MFAAPSRHTSHRGLRCRSKRPVCLPKRSSQACGDPPLHSAGAALSQADGDTRDGLGLLSRPRVASMDHGPWNGGGDWQAQSVLSCAEHGSGAVAFATAPGRACRRCGLSLDGRLRAANWLGWDDGNRPSADVRPHWLTARIRLVSNIRGRGTESSRRGLLVIVARNYRTYAGPSIPVVPPRSVGWVMALCDQLEAQLSSTQADSRRLLGAVLDAALDFS
jgi:hypothetical protein